MSNNVLCMAASGGACRLRVLLCFVLYTVLNMVPCVVCVSSALYSVICSVVCSSVPSDMS